MSSDIQSQIDRLGFDAWADNQFVNALETFVIPSGRLGSGNTLIEHYDYTIRLEWDSGSANCSIMCHTKDGWQSYEKEYKR